MALIVCENCGREISDTSKKCVHCGAVVKKSNNQLGGAKKRSANAIRKLIQIFGFIPAFGGMLILAIILFFGMLIGALSPLSSLGFGDVVSSSSVSSLLQATPFVIGLFLTEIFALAKLGKKTSNLFTQIVK